MQCMHAYVIQFFHYSISAICNFTLETKSSDGDQSDVPAKLNEPRLQRSRAQSRKIFRFRQSRRMEVISNFK